MNWVGWTEIKINIPCESLCEKNVPKWETIEKTKTLLVQGIPCV